MQISNCLAVNNTTATSAKNAPVVYSPFYKSDVKGATYLERAQVESKNTYDFKTAAVEEAMRRTLLKATAVVSGVSALALATVCVIGVAATAPFSVPTIILYSAGTIVSLVITGASISKLKAISQKTERCMIVGKYNSKLHEIEKKSATQLQKMVPITLSKADAKKMKTLIARYQFWKNEERKFEKIASQTRSRFKAATEEQAFKRKIELARESTLKAKVNASFHLAVMKQSKFSGQPQNAYSFKGMSVDTASKKPCLDVSVKGTVFLVSSKMNHKEIATIFAKVLAA